ncbi:MAG: hypothetical protein D5S00_00120 [Tindallia sp. MSAO_Bac2]|nr:MAG: hypothetical protein D5S00_00120 [Tindallia sp. MSAO_Bac2]
MKPVIAAKSFEQLLKALHQLSSKYLVVAPTTEDGVEHYRPITQMSEEQKSQVERLSLRNQPPLGSVKPFLFPDSEIYIEFTKKDGKLDVQTPRASVPQIILGAKPCDVVSLELIDKVFLEDPVDGLYQEKRDNTVLIVNQCDEMGANCRCDDFGVQRSTGSADLLMSKDESSGKILLKAQSEKGNILAEELLKEGMEENPVFREPKVPVKEALESEKIQQAMDDFFESPFWEELAMRCIGCATCTFYCPTCHCYDIRDFQRKEQGARYRTWDSCMFPDYTRMAGGHNPRPTRKDRVQNRFYHKLSYFVKNEGALGCVGCGRCGEKCPVGISMDTVLNRIGGEVNDK